MRQNALVVGENFGVDFFSERDVSDIEGVPSVVKNPRNFQKSFSIKIFEIFQPI